MAAAVYTACTFQAGILRTIYDHWLSPLPQSYCAVRFHNQWGRAGWQLGRRHLTH